jgi:hypothetical protein
VKIRIALLVFVLELVLRAVPSSANPELRDGRHDFDFHFGTWKAHISLLADAGSTEPRWVELNGTVKVTKIWGGRANVEELEANGPKRSLNSLALYVYNPDAHQWTVNFSDPREGVLSDHAAVGEFKNGRGEFFNEELSGGKPLLVRVTWSEITADAHRLERAVSSDGGRTWKTVFAASLTRTTQATARVATATRDDRDGADAFDFARGTWKESTTRLLRPLTGSKTWIRLNGVSIDHPLFDGRANLVELESDGPKGHLELLSLRLYNSHSRQWNLYFATSNVGIVSDAMTGSFKNGHGEFFSNDSLDGRAILVRFMFDSFGPTKARSQQAFSNDGGRTWETNWINNYTRVSAAD